MRAVILLNPKVPVEHFELGRQYAEASIGFDYTGDITDKKAIGAHLQELGKMLASSDDVEAAEDL